MSLKENNLILDDISTINKLHELADVFNNIRGMNRVSSILNATFISSHDDEIEVKQFIPKNIKQIRLTDQIKDISIYPELSPFVSKNRDSLLFYLPFGYSVLPTDILKSIENVQSSSDLKFSFTGKSPIIAITEKLLSKDITIFLPLLFLFVLIIFLAFRSVKAILSAWLIILLSVSVSYCFLKFLNIEITPLILLVPVFALGLLSDYIIHYIYHLFYAPGLQNSFQVRKALLYPLSLTALSTITGFISLIYINASGHILLGTIIALSVILTFIGVVLWLPYLNFKAPDKNILPKFSYLQNILFNKLYAKKNYLFIILILGVIWGIVQLPNLKIEPYPIEQLPQNSTIREAENLINRDFYGALPFFIEIDTGEANSFLNKDTLLILDEIHNSLDKNKSIGNSNSLLTVLKRINYYFLGDEEPLLQSTTYDEIYPALIEGYLLYYTSGVDPLEYESFVDQSYRYFSIKGYVKYLNVSNLDSFNKTIDQIKTTLPQNWKLSVHGVLEELESEKIGLTKNWIFSFAFGSFLIFMTVFIFYKKLKLALLSLLPGFISMILSFGIISIMDIAIDSFSIIFVAIITGLVIDYSIHTLSALDKVSEIRSIKEGFNYINSYSGIPIFLSFLTSLASFSVLFLSSFKGARSLGILLFASLIISYILSLYLLPIIVLPTKLNNKEQ
ncbi:MAG: hypothetical protein OCD02_10930 [Spirochaetaceae bacterium]